MLTQNKMCNYSQKQCEKFNQDIKDVSSRLYVTMMVGYAGWYVEIN